MPCYDSRNDGAYVYAEAMKQIDELTDMLCKLCQAVEGYKPELIQQHSTLSTWWQEHQRQDLARQRREQQKRDDALLIQKALDKLTVAERRALGLKDQI